MCFFLSSEKRRTTATYFFSLSLISTQHVDVDIWVGVPPLAVCVCHCCHCPYAGYCSYYHTHQQYGALSKYSLQLVLFIMPNITKSQICVRDLENCTTPITPEEAYLPQDTQTWNTSHVYCSRGHKKTSPRKYMILGWTISFHADLTRSASWWDGGWSGGCQRTSARICTIIDSIWASFQVDWSNINGNVVDSVNFEQKMPPCGNYRCSK